MTSFVPVAGQISSRTIQGVETYRRDSTYKKLVAEITTKLQACQAELQQLTDWYQELTDGEILKIQAQQKEVPTLSETIAKYKWTAILVAVNLIAFAFVITLARKP